MKAGQAADVLEKAADILVTDGHCKWIQRDEDGNYCAVGALYAALGAKLALRGSGPWRGPIGNSVRQLSAVVVDTLGISLPYLNAHQSARLANWNNEDARTGDDVIEAFRTAARDLRNTRDADEELPPVIII